MRTFKFSQETLQRIELFESTGSFSKQLAGGEHGLAVHCVRFEPGGQIGEHPTGREQLFLVVEGEGWLVGENGESVQLQSGDGVYLRRNERHSKGSDGGMVAIMIQSDKFEDVN